MTGTVVRIVALVVVIVIMYALAQAYVGYR